MCQLRSLSGPACGGVFRLANNIQICLTIYTFLVLIIHKLVFLQKTLQSSRTMDVVNDVVVSDVNEMVAQMHRDVSDDISNAQTNAEAGQMPSLNEYRDERTESKALELDRHQLFVDSWRTLFNIIEE